MGMDRKELVKRAYANVRSSHREAEEMLPECPPNIGLLLEMVDEIVMHRLAERGGNNPRKKRSS